MKSYPQSVPLYPRAHVRPFFPSSAAVLLPLALLGGFSARAAVPHDWIHLLAKPNPGLNERQVGQLVSGVGAREVGQVPPLNVRILQLPSRVAAQALAALQKNPQIEFAEVDELLPPGSSLSDPLLGSSWHLHKVQAPSAWDVSFGSASVTIGIVDSGVDGTHPDLMPNLVAGWNFYNGNNITADPEGHGTGVAGVAAAVGNNGAGGAGLAWGCKIMPLRVGDSTGWATFSAMAQAITYAADRGVRVVNLSYTASGSSTVNSAAQYLISRGGLLVVSSGNDGTFNSMSDNPNLLTVGATDVNDNLASWSNTGNHIDLVAPGVGIQLTVPGGYASWSGTSFSSPIVVGVAALVFSRNPALSPFDVMQILTQTADDRGPLGWDSQFGWGRLNASEAVQSALSFVPTDGTPPSVQLTAPAAGSAVSGVVSVSGSASDNIGVTLTSLFIDGILVASTSGLPPTFQWNTLNSADGSHTLQLKSYDAAGNTGLSSARTVSLQNTPDTVSPTVAFTAPVAGAKVSRSLKATLQVSDNRAVVRTELWVNNKLVATTTAVPASFQLNTSKWSAGSHVLTGRAFDAAGNMGLASVTVLK